MIEDDDMDAAAANSELTRQSPLSDQTKVLTRASDEVRERIRRDKLRIMADYRERVAAIDNQYEHDISDAVAALESSRRRALETAEDMMREEVASLESIGYRLARIR